MARATKQTTTDRIVARRNNVVEVLFTDPQPKFPGAPGVRLVEQEPDDNPSTIQEGDDVLRVALYPYGRRVA